MSSGPAFDTKERVRQATDIVDLVGSYLDLRRQGQHYVGLCPWHDDSRPSLQVNPQRQSWKCWVCDVGGDVFSFVMRREGVEFLEAMALLADRAGIELSASRRAISATDGTSEKQTLFKALAWAEGQFHTCLMQHPEAESARQYLAERGFSSESLKRFRIGCSPDHWSWLLDRSRSTPFSPKQLQLCGLLGTSQQTGQHYDRFKGRLIFPIRDVQDRPIAFGGRILPELAAKGQQTGRSIAKYVNSPETRLFSKSEHLYGLNLARETLSKNRHLVIVEGYTDVVMAWQQGLQNVAAVLGTALNERHIRLIKRFADTITLVLDGDEAGQRRTNEVLDLFVAASVDLKILTLPAGQDPCDYLLERGAAAMQAELDRAADALEHKIRIETAGIDLVSQTHQANQALENILTTIARAPKLSSTAASANQLRQQQLLARLARQFHLELPELKIRLADLRRRTHSNRASREAQTAEPRSLAAIDRKETELLEILILQPSAMTTLVENISPDQFVLGPARDLYEAYCQRFDRDQPVDFQSMMTHLEDVHLKHLLAELDERATEKLSESDSNVDQWLQSVIHAFHKQVNEFQLRQTIAALEENRLSEEEEEQALEQIFQQKQAEQKLNQHGLSTPMDG